MIDFLLTAALLVFATAAVGMVRVLRGPTAADRIMAAQLLGTGGIAALLLVGQAVAMPELTDVALILALLAAFASAVMTRGTPGRADEQEPPS